MAAQQVDSLALPTMATSMLSIRSATAGCKPSHSNEDCVGRRWTFEYKNAPIPEESQGLESVPPEVQVLLQVAACLQSLEKRLCSAALPKSTDLSGCYDKAVELGLIVAVQDGSYAFLNTETQEVAYNLIPEHERAQFHLDVGRKLAKNLSQSELEDKTFLILRQFHHGMDKMTSRNEKRAIASLCTTAAQQAVSESNFVAAKLYLEFGITLVGDEAWKNDYDLTLSLYNAAAEVEYCLANFSKMDEYVDQVLGIQSKQANHTSKQQSWYDM